ncbi:lysine--tRNA ligase [Dermatophilus congolensis]|uniref:Lysine--tRNA ligase n=1 Tax=Dermatophilus congolensis TaxID=1863 RepID=A0A239VUW3_9MICO|nr:lysine--tRNA ligase [Dermatophilus congolensis]SNV26085.1 Lysine--tRNA ligase [Dermatophilus congolensis]
MARSNSTNTPEIGDWVDRLADEVIETATARKPGEKIVCASGLSPSGPIHLGNLREVMVPHLVADEIRRRGYDVEHIISWDDYDRYRKVPFGVEGIDESWAEHIGKPLTSVPAPRGSQYPNWAEHFKAAMTESLGHLGVQFRGISQTAQYTSGVYVEAILHAMEHRAEIDAVLARYRTKVDPQAAAEVARAEGADEAEVTAVEGSGAASEDDGSGAGDYYPFKPYSLAFGTDNTQVTSYDPQSTLLTYIATGPNGEQVEESMHLNTDFRGKLVWKVDWPMRWAHEGVDFEPSGVDHQSPGSSWVVGKDIAPIFGAQRPIGPMYAFVGIAGMAKMSSSKGGVPTPADALSIMEPQLLRWMYARRKPNQSFQVAFDAEIQRLYDEWDALGRKIGTDKAQPGDLSVYKRSIGTAAGELPRTERPLPYRAIASTADITGGNPEQMQRILGAMIASGEPELGSLEELQPRLSKAMKWVETQMAPEDRTQVRSEPDTELLTSLDEAQRESLALLADKLEEDWSLEGLTTLVYGVPKLQAGLPIHEKKLPPEVKAAQRSLFALLYRLLIGRETGPRLPTLLLIVGPEKIRTLIGH